MASKSIYDSVVLSEIDWDDHRFRVSTSGPSGPLAASIRRLGLITPPVLLRQNGVCVIVSGFNRLEVCRQLGRQRITARILGSQTPLEYCIHIAVAENTFSRELNLIEKGRIVQMLDQLYPDQVELCKEAKRLGVPLNFDMARKLRTVVQMNTILQNALSMGHIALPMALKIHEMAEETTANKISQIFMKMGLGLNRQREFLDWLVGISRRECISIEKLIEDRDLNTILDDPDTDRKQKSVLARQYLKKRRFPEISRIDKRYQEVMQSLRFGKGVRLIPPAHFEGQTYALKIDFTHYEELVSRYQDLEKKIQSSALRSLWETLGFK
jgi:hypothetical protein